jgi:UDP-N-acetylglucosamine 1-carboxyvinyltransferase
MDEPKLSERRCMPRQTSDVITIRGGTPLHGEVQIRGAKNSVPKNMVAALLTSEPCVLQNVADVQDVEIVSQMISALGGRVDRDHDGICTIHAERLEPMPSDRLQEFIGKSRIPVLLCGPLLARLGRATIPKLGGCQIGPRPVDFHLDALRKFGAEVEERDYGWELKARKLEGAKIRLEYPSVGATEQVILSAVLANGTTELSNAAVEPEIIDLIALLQNMGAIISVSTDRVITVIGVDQLHGYEHAALPDRLEAVSWACAAAATNGRITVRGARQLDMMTFLNRFRQIGGEFKVHSDAIEFWRGSRLMSIALETDVHPGFMTDWQQPFVIALTQSHGVSVIHETVYENRFGYVESLNRMGAQIQLYDECLGAHPCRFGRRNHRHSAVVVGPTPLSGATIEIPDLRAGFSYVIAALVADGVSTVKNIQLIRRGYERFFGKLAELGARYD